MCRTRGRGRQRALAESYVCGNRIVNLRERGGHRDGACGHSESACVAAARKADAGAGAGIGGRDAAQLVACRRVCRDCDGVADLRCAGIADVAAARTWRAGDGIGDFRKRGRHRDIGGRHVEFFCTLVDVDCRSPCGRVGKRIKLVA